MTSKCARDVNPVPATLVQGLGPSIALGPVILVDPRHDPSPDPFPFVGLYGLVR